MSHDGKSCQAWSRRELLTMASGVAAASAFGGLTACTSGPEEPPVVEVALDSVPDGGRLEVLLGEMPVELRRTADSVQARSMWCTHSGCLVKWQEERGIYFCACHEGKYDAQGRPIEGPPPRPLSQVPVTVDGGTVRVGGVL